MDLNTTIAEYERLVERAVLVLGHAPFWCFVPHREYARLSIEGDTATLTWPTLEHSYGDYFIVPESGSFPADLLTLPDNELSAWKAEQERQHQLEQEAKGRERAALVRQQELAALAALKAKYERTD